MFTAKIAKRNIVVRFLIVQHKNFYYMEESVLLGTKPFVDFIRHSIQDPSGVFFRMSPLRVSYHTLTTRFPPITTLLNELGFLPRLLFASRFV